MGKVSAFIFTSLDGYFEGPNHDISWHLHDAETDGFAVEMLGAGNTLLFGRMTYELMAGYWPTIEAGNNAPIVAEGMNKTEKIVFSTTLNRVEWNNTRLVKGNIEDEIRKLKALPDKNMTLLGSGSILTQLAQQGLIDEYLIMIDPVVLGSGTSLFKGINHNPGLKLTATKVFSNGVVLLRYQPAERT